MRAIVIGAGVLGASTAYQLAKRGCEVTLLDRGNPGDAASAASFAWLNSANKKQREYHDLNVMSIAEWSSIARELGSSDWLHLSGNLHIAGSAQDSEKLAERVERLHSYGYAAIPVPVGDLARIDPVVRPRESYELAVFFPGEGHITVPLLVHDLLRAVRGMGGVVRSNADVVELLGDADGIRGVVLAGGDRLEADVVVLAAGAGIGEVLATQGIEVRTEGSPGASVTTSPGSSSLSTMLHLPGLSVRPDATGRLVVRSSAGDAAIDRDSWTLPASAIDALLEATSEALTDAEAGSMRAERVQIAARPYPFDGLPAVGYWDGLPQLYVLTMHSGVTMGAIMGRLAAEEIMTGRQARLLDGFRPTRVIEAAASGAGYFDPYEVEGEKAVTP